VCERLWGEPETVIHEVVPLIPHVDVYVHPPGHMGRGYYTDVSAAGPALVCWRVGAVLVVAQEVP
jgi:hypothetical protein